MVFFGSFSGYYSWRNKQHGSWFIQSLCQELLQNGSTYDLLTLLTFVKQAVSIDFESATDELETTGMKQIPCHISMLTRLLVFADKKSL